jgi:peptidoglycan hydrolase-like protein with peptidoglycan-binding domain
MQFDKTLAMSATPGRRADGDRNIVTAEETVRSLQQVLKGRSYYAGDATGKLDQATRDALARFQLDQGQPATGDADEATVRALGVRVAGNSAK